MTQRIYILGLIIFTLTACAQKKRIPLDLKSKSISERKLNRLKKVLQNYVDNGQIAGIQTAILKEDSLVHFDSYGYADIENKLPINDKSIFRIFSMTKPITSVGLMQLYEQGLFKLDDPVSQYIPEFKHMTVYDTSNTIVQAKKEIRIIDLLRHTSGISYGRSPNSELNTKYNEANLRHSKNLKSFIENISQLPLLFEPGTAYEYGYSTDICGYLIEILSGQPINEYLQKNIFDPLHMKDTHFQLPKEKINHLTVGYRPGDNDTLEITDTPEQSMFTNKVTFFKAGGGLVSTTNDYLNFCHMLLNGGSLFNTEIITPETLDIMTKDHLEPVRTYTPRLRILPNETGFGLGFSIAEREDGSIVYGWGGAVGTYFRIDPKHKLAYVMMIQLSPYRQLGLRERFQSLVNDVVEK